MRNAGKIFEDDIRKSIPDYCCTIRLKDTAQAFKQSSLTSFTRENQCDFLVFDDVNRRLYAFELKSTKYKSMSIQLEKDSDEKKMIKYHQITSLHKLNQFENVTAGFIFNFRDEEHDMERTYFQNIDDFEIMCAKTGKKSLNEIDIILYGAKKIKGKKKRVHYSWDMDNFFNPQE